MRKIFFTIILLFISVVQAETVVKSLLRDDHSQIRYYHQVQGKQNNTLLLVIQSGACISVFHQLDTRLLLEKLNFNADILWVEKYGLTNESASSVCPREYTENNSPLHRLDDYLKVLDEFGHQYSKIIVIGAQEGAAIASLLLADDKLPISAGIVINSGGGSYANDAIWRIEKQPIDVIDNDHPVISRFLEQAKDGDLPKNISFQNHGYRWWYEMLNMNMYETLKKSTKPLLIVQGLADREVSSDNSQALYYRLIKRENVTVYYYESLTHEFSDNFRLPDIDDAVIDVRHWLEQL